MSVADYIATLQKTKTYQAGLISFQEYSFIPRMLGLGRVLPKIPHADDDRHVIVMEIRGDQPNILTVLKGSNDSIHITTKDVDKLLFIFVEMRPHTLIVDKSEDGYRLGDGHRIDAKFTVTYKIEDAKNFWMGSKDQLSEFEATITNAAKNFFLNHFSHYFIRYPADLKNRLEKHIHGTDTEIKVVKNNLEVSIYQDCTVAGIKLEKVIADVYISDSLNKYLKRIHDILYGEGGAAERLMIDQIIDNYTTFDYPLRKVINAIDMRLIENFYTMKWSEAMRKVTEKVAEKKQEYMMSVEQKELKRMRELLDSADDLDLDPVDVEVLKTKFAKKLISIAEKTTNAHPISDKEYLKIIMSLSSDRLLESNSKNDKVTEKE